MSSEEMRFTWGATDSGSTSGLATEKPKPWISASHLWVVYNTTELCQRMDSQVLSHSKYIILIYTRTSVENRKLVTSILGKKTTWIQLPEGVHKTGMTLRNQLEPDMWLFEGLWLFLIHNVSIFTILIRKVNPFGSEQCSEPLKLRLFFLLPTSYEEGTLVSAMIECIILNNFGRFYR